MADKKNNQGNTLNSSKTRLSQNALPIFSLEDSLKIAYAIKDNYAGRPSNPLLVAEACGVSPTSSNWRYLTGSSIAYGITEGGYNAQTISLTALGERIVSPLKEGDDNIAKREAVLIPGILGDFYKTYNNNKIPRKDICLNVLSKKGVPVERLESTYEMIRKNATYVGIFKIISGNEFVCLDIVKNSKISDTTTTIANVEEELPEELANRMNLDIPEKKPDVTQPAIIKNEKPHVFISHGKHSQVIVNQLKELLSYGQMVPIVSVERETTAVPVPDKVFDDMRNCDAGIINVEYERVSTQAGGTELRLNENVLIEIGAAIALYQKKIILLCKKGTVLPSNLQGLYRCEYEGDQLDYSSTMKLLKTMQELRAMM